MFYSLIEALVFPPSHSLLYCSLGYSRPGSLRVGRLRCTSIRNLCFGSSGSPTWYLSLITPSQREDAVALYGWNKSNYWFLWYVGLYDKNPYVYFTKVYNSTFWCTLVGIGIYYMNSIIVSKHAYFLDYRYLWFQN